MNLHLYILNCSVTSLKFMTKQFSEVCCQMSSTLITAVFRSLFHRRDARQRRGWCNGGCSDQKKVYRLYISFHSFAKQDISLSIGSRKQGWGPKYLAHLFPKSRDQPPLLPVHKCIGLRLNLTPKVLVSQRLREVTIHCII